MVRLKEEKTIQKAGTYTISIPYGAIKRYSPKYVRVPFFLFQFLMVRLKAAALAN